jgi:putative N6-adenine-specific DNA methylase
VTELSIIATSPFGLEAIVKRELQDLGYSNLSVENGYVTFEGDEQALVRSNLWLRTADRVMLKIGAFHANTFDSLYEQTKALPWSNFLPKDARFPVEGRSVKSQLSSVPACQRIVKKAIVDSLANQYHLQTFPETGPLFTVEVSILKDDVLLTIDASGAGLHKRGYRQLSATAPIKETLAAALVKLSRWEPHRPFADPLCGSGTIAIEAALIARNIAPGLNRSFVSEDWPLLTDKLWADEKASAFAAIKKDCPVEILASDVDNSVLSLAEYHTRKAGVADCIQLTRQDVGDFAPGSAYGCIVTNPPYGDRLGEKADAEKLYRKMGKSFAKLNAWSVFVITSHPSFERLYGKPADKKRKLYNGRIQTNYFQYLGPLPPRQFPSQSGHSN